MKPSIEQAPGEPQPSTSAPPTLFKLRSAPQKSLISPLSLSVSLLALASSLSLITQSRERGLGHKRKFQFEIEPIIYGSKISARSAHKIHNFPVNLCPLSLHCLQSGSGSIDPLLYIFSSILRCCCSIDLSIFAFCQLGFVDM